MVINSVNIIGILWHLILLAHHPIIGDDINLEPAIRDAIILNLAVNPLCNEDCPGLEEKQGQNWSYLPVVESESPADQRWAALKDFPLKN